MIFDLSKEKNIAMLLGILSVPIIVGVVVSFITPFNDILLNIVFAPLFLIFLGPLAATLGETYLQFITAYLTWPILFVAVAVTFRFLKVEKYKLAFAVWAGFLASYYLTFLLVLIINAEVLFKIF